MAQATCQNCGSEIDLRPGKADGKVDGEVVVHTYGSNAEPDMVAESDYYCNLQCVSEVGE